MVDETLKNIPKARCEACEKVGKFEKIYSRNFFKIISHTFQVFQVSSEDTLFINENNKAKEEDTGELFNLD